MLYWFYYYPLEHTLKAIFSGCILIYFFHYLHSWWLSLTVHKTSILMGILLFSLFFRDITWLSSISTFSCYAHLYGDFINSHLQSLSVLESFSGPPLHFWAFSYHIMLLHFLLSIFFAGNNTTVLPVAQPCNNVLLHSSSIQMPLLHAKHSLMTFLINIFVLSPQLWLSKVTPQPWLL